MAILKPEINDTATTAGNLWSASKINTELSSTLPSTGGTITGNLIVTGSARASGFSDTDFTAGKFLATNTSRTIVSALAGGVLTAGTLVAGSGYVAATYYNVPLTGGDGTNAQATIVVATGGNISTTNNLVAGVGYVTGSYSAVPLTGGSGTNATADIEVSIIKDAIKNKLEFVQNAQGELEEFDQSNYKEKYLNYIDEQYNRFKEETLFELKKEII